MGRSNDPLTLSRYPAGAMTQAFITIDTEYSSGLFTGADKAAREDNFARSIACITPDGPAGITHKLAKFAEHDVKAVFFVDPMPAMIWGIAAIEDVVGPIIEAGQDVQLHCHTEWLELAGSKAVLKDRTGGNIKDFAFEEQCQLLEYARDVLIAAGAPKPVAFRAGNYGADNDTLRALAAVGIRYDSSHCPALVESGPCEITLTERDRSPMLHEGIIEVPVGAIATITGGLRHAQITALSLGEMSAALRYARSTDQPSFTLVTHSFELVNRSKMTLNRVVNARFEGLCEALADMEGVTTGNYRDTPPLHGSASNPLPSDPLPANPLRTGWRLAEQLASNTLYGSL